MVTTILLKRTEWYAFADICGNNNHNSVQINDINYVYQALGPAPAPGGLSVEHDSGMQVTESSDPVMLPNLMVQVLPRVLLTNLS